MNGGGMDGSVAQLLEPAGRRPSLRFALTPAKKPGLRLIGTRFTGLRGALDFDDGACQRFVTLDPGPPPSALQPLHDPKLLGHWLARALALLADPVSEERRGGVRRVQILGTAVFEFAADGTITPYLWQFDEHDRMRLAYVPASDVAALDIPHGDIWLRRLGLGMQRVLRSRHPGQADACAAYVDWALAAILRCCWGRQQQRHTRRVIEQALGLDQEALTYASAWLNRGGAGVLRLSHYNRALMVAEPLASVDRELPQLSLLYRLTSAAVPVDGEPGQCLKQWLLDNGIRPAFWRLLHRCGSAWMEELLDFYVIGPGGAAAVAIDLLKVAQAFGAAQPVQPWLLAAAMAIGGHPHRPRQRYARVIEDSAAVCARLGHIAAKADASQLERLRSEVHEIFGWACENGTDDMARTVRQAPLDWFVSQASAWRASETFKAQSGPVWSVPYVLTSNDPRWSVHPIDSAHALWLEARAMKHCVDRYIDDCEEGQMLIVAVRSVANGRSVATIGFHLRLSGVTLFQVAGFANRRVEPALLVLTDELLAQMRLQHVVDYEPKLQAKTRRPRRRAAGPVAPDIADGLFICRRQD